MGEAVMDFFLYNERKYKTSEFENIYKDNAPSIYEVIRIIDGIPLFLEEHIQRFKNSAAIIGYDITIGFDTIKAGIEKIIHLNNVSNNNIKIIANNFSQKTDYYYFFIKSSYPEEQLYRLGIKTMLYDSTRENPNAKIINKSLRWEVDALLAKNNCYEALLVNSSGEVTEGSRSNVFFIKAGRVYTSPAEGVLLGITRQKIIKLCRENAIEVIEAPIYSKNLGSYSAAFISGTSPKVLPISWIDTIQYSPSEDTLLRIMDIYNNEISTYLKNHS